MVCWVPTARHAFRVTGALVVQVLLDFGLAEELTPRVRQHFLSFLFAIGAGNGTAGARHMLAFGAEQVRAGSTAASVLVHVLGAYMEPMVPVMACLWNKIVRAHSCRLMSC
jgi:hypothetical protein